MEKKSFGEQAKNSSTLSQAPPLYVEPLRGIEPDKIKCEICGEAFTAKSQLESHI